MTEKLQTTIWEVACDRCRNSTFVGTHEQRYNAGWRKYWIRVSGAATRLQQDLCPECVKVHGQAAVPAEGDVI